LKRLARLKLTHNKHTAYSPPARIPTPPVVTIPMLMHIGAPAKPIVKAGDEVKVYQRIADAGGFVSSPVYSGVSGTVKSVGTARLASGQTAEAVVIETDGKQTPLPGITPPSVTSFEGFLEAVRESGVVGLGGAGFPTAVKLSIKDANRCEYVLINGAECEPYVTSDMRTMLDDGDMVWEGVLLIKRYFPRARIIIGIEDNKPECVESFRGRCETESGVEVAALRTRYPQGGEKMLIHATTGRVVPEDKLPIDAGVLVLNCTTLAVLARYIKTGVPLVEKCVTVDGPAVREPRNVISPIGTPVSALFDFCGGFVSEPKKVLFGGPMMGVAVADLDAPVMKNVNAVLAFAERDAELPAQTACIRCGRCVEICPMDLSPVQIEIAYQLGRAELLEKHKVNLCIECGNCAYVCPAHRRLVQVMKLSKPLLKKYRDEKKAAEKEASRT